MHIAIYSYRCSHLDPPAYNDTSCTVDILKQVYGRYNILYCFVSFQSLVQFVNLPEHFEILFEITKIIKILKSEIKPQIAFNIKLRFL